jgi:hypothetical protein
MPPLPAIDLADDASEPVIIEAAATAFGWHHDLGLIEDCVVRGRCREELDLSDLLLHRLLVGQCSSSVGEFATPWKPTRCCSCALKAVAVSCAQERKEPNALASDPCRLSRKNPAEKIKENQIKREENDAFTVLEREKNHNPILTEALRMAQPRSSMTRARGRGGDRLTMLELREVRPAPARPANVGRGRGWSWHGWAGLASGWCRGGVAPAGARAKIGAETKGWALGEKRMSLRRKIEDRMIMGLMFLGPPPWLRNIRPPPYVPRGLVLPDVHK